MFSAEIKGGNINNSAKIALVTGGSRGLGRATVEALAQRGVNVVLTYNAHFAEANEVVARVEAQGSRAIALPFSAGETDTFEDLSAPFRRRWRSWGPIGFITWSIMPATPAAWVFLTLRKRNSMRCIVST
ncbi:7-alpha-hydroxysteroid dehydrogenase [Klebsiella variicola]|nr:7-alpha-hydroxysteroid dehydrogenase [Klebsiella variicola]